MEQLTSKVSALTKCFGGALVLHLLCYLLFGIYYSEYTDRFLTAYVDGSFSGGITKPVFYNYGFNTGVSHAMAIGYSLLPQLNWYGIFGAAIMLMATTGLFYLAYTHWQSFAGRKWLAVGAYVFLLPFWCYHIVLHRTTELASLACGIGILGLVATYFPTVAQRLTHGVQVRVFYTLLILVSIFLRMEPTLLCTGIFLPYGLWVALNSKARRGLLKISLVVLPVFAGAYMLYLSAPGPAEVIFRDTRVYTHTLWDFGQEEHFYHPKTAADSVKLEASLAYFISDEVMLSPEFYSQVGVIPLEKSLSSFTNYFIGFNYRVQKALDVWYVLAQEQTLFFVAYGLAMAFALLLLWLNHERKKLALLLGLQLWFVAILFGVTVFMKMELRVMTPLVTLNLIVLTLYTVLLLPNGWLANKTNGWLLVVASMVFIWPMIHKSADLWHSASNYKVANENIQAFKTELKQPTFNNRIIVFHSFAWQMLYGNLFDNNEFAQNTNFLAVDNGEMYMYPQFRKAMVACCGGYTVKSIIDYLLANKESVVFVSDAGRMDLIERYVETVYGVPFNTKQAFPESVLQKPKGGVMMPEYASHLVFSYYIFD